MPHMTIKAHDSTHISSTFWNDGALCVAPKAAFIARTWTSRRHVIITDRMKLTEMATINNARRTGSTRAENARP
jgi:hypothetical protein